MTSFAFVIRAGPVAAPSNRGRYEYRIWPRSTPPIAAALQRDWVLDGAEKRDDIYLLGPNSPNALVKLRDGSRLEIKRRAPDHRDLQNWWVALSEEFPLSQSALRQLAAALFISELPPQVASLSPAHFLAALSRHSASSRILTVRKSRLSFRRQSCLAEITRVVWNNRTGLTIALEDPDPDRANQAVNALGLRQWPNRSYGDVLCAQPRLITEPAQPRKV